MPRPPTPACTSASYAPCARDVNFAGEAIWVRRNAPTSAPADAKPRAPKSGKGRRLG